jgi:hypothetical protein
MEDYNLQINQLLITSPEYKLVSEILGAIRDKWDIYEEVEGTCFNGRRKRIDAIIKSKETGIAFGVEFKRKDLDGFSNFSSWLKQSIGYSLTDFPGFGRIPILVCPGMEYPNKDINFVLKRVAGDFALGELVKITNKYNGDYYRILFKDYVYWDSRNGFSETSKKMKFDNKLNF